MKDEIMPILTDYGEFTLDYFLKEGPAKDIPIISTILNLVKLGLTISDRIFVEKLKKFIDNVETNNEWKDKFASNEECKKISKKLLYIINSCDEDEKLKLIGLTFNRFVNGELSKDEYFYITNIISKSFYPYLRLLTKIDVSDGRFENNGEKYDYNGVSHLLSIGLLNETGRTIVTVKYGGKAITPSNAIVSINEYGKFLKELLIASNQEIAHLE